MLFFADDSNKINSIYLTSRISSLISKVSDMNISGKYKGNEGFEEETVHSPLQALENVTVVPRSDGNFRFLLKCKLPLNLKSFSQYLIFRWT